MVQVVSILRDTSLFMDFPNRVIHIHTQGGTVKRSAVFLRGLAAFLNHLTKRHAPLAMIALDRLHGAQPFPVATSAANAAVTRF